MTLSTILSPTPIDVTTLKNTLPTKAKQNLPVPGSTFISDTQIKMYEHADFLPSFPDVAWPTLEEFSVEDKGLLGHPEYKDLLAEATDYFDYTPKIGTEIHGVNLRRLTDAQKNDLARLLAVRGCVFFREQNDFTVDDQLELGRHFGKLHKHATTAIPRKAGYDEIHVVYTDEKSKSQAALFTPTYLWHSDVTYELQPPSYTSLKLLTGPPRGAGGDTLWSSQYAVYDMLSPAMQRYLEGLTALHSAHEQAEGSIRAGRPVRREPVITEHPVIRVHPVTGWKSVFINPGFTKQIVGVPKGESDVILRYLSEVIATSQENFARFRWEVGSVAFWDNRICNHSASYGFAPHRRHAVRVTPHGERPFYSDQGKSQEEELNARDGRPNPDKDGSAVSNYND